MNDRIAPGGDEPHDPLMEARTAAVETNVREIKGILLRLEPAIGRLTGKVEHIDGQVQQIDDRLRRVEVEALPKLGADIAELRGRVSQLPTTIALLGFVVAVLVAGGLMRHLFP